MKGNPDQTFEIVEPSPRFRLMPFDNTSLSTEAAYLIKGLVPRGGLTVAWGPPKCGKSFWTFDLVMHIALGLPYRDRRVQQGPIVYVAAEGAHGFRARIAAYRQANVIERDGPVPFYLVPSRLDLIADADALIADIRSQAEPPAVVVVDTLNRTLNGSESRDEDMAAYIGAADLIREAFGCAVIVVHHCGVDATRPRGHTSLAGAVDCQIKVTRSATGTITSEVEWQKDGVEGEVVHSRLEAVTVGQDDDGDDITSCVIVATEATAAAPPGPKLSKNQQTYYTLLRDAGPEGLTTGEWRDKAIEVGLGRRRPADHCDWRSALKSKQLVHAFNDRWYVTQPST